MLTSAGFEFFIRSEVLAFNGASTWRNPSMFASIQRGRSTTSTGAVPLGAVRPVTCRT